jgi:hypothetical protein
MLFEEETFGASGSSLSVTLEASGMFIRMVASASIRVTPAPSPLSLPSARNNGSAGSTESRARFVVVPRGIPTTLNTPALHPVLMLDGRQPTLTSQATGAIHDHAHNTIEPTLELKLL